MLALDVERKTARGRQQKSIFVFKERLFIISLEVIETSKQNRFVVGVFDNSQKNKKISIAKKSINPTSLI